MTVSTFDCHYLFAGTLLEPLCEAQTLKERVIDRRRDSEKTSIHQSLDTFFSRLLFSPSKTAKQLARAQKEHGGRCQVRF